jgi:pSer/pThr/pTyr-binding forkhead associated (FHA) protein
MSGLADTFRTGCGAAGPLRLGCGPVGQPPEQARAFETPFVLVGRDERNDLVLAHQAVSRRHAYLQLLGGRLFCLDLKSRFGMRLGGEHKPSGWLGSGPLVLWPYELTLDAPRPPDGPEPPDPLTTRTLDPEGLPEVVLETHNGSVKRARWRMTRALALAGQHPACKLHFIHPTVSAFHCAWVRTPGGLWVIDLLSRAGVLVNGAPVRWTRLGDGDRVQVGQYEVLVRVKPPPAARPAARPAAETPAAPLPPAPADAPPAAEETFLPAPLLSAAAPPALPTLLPAPVDTGLAELQRSLGTGGESGLLLAVVNQLQAMQQQMFEHYQQSLVTLVQVLARLHGDQMETVRQELDQLRGLTDELQQLRAQLNADPPAAAAGPPEAAGQARTALPAPPAAPKAPAAAAAGPAGQSKDRPAAGAELHAWLNQRIADLQRERQGRWQKVLSFVLGR